MRTVEWCDACDDYHPASEHTRDTSPPMPDVESDASNAEWELAMSTRLHEIADTMNDAADHDELHAAAALLAHDNSARGQDYVGRWLAALISRHVYPQGTSKGDDLERREPTNGSAG